MASQGPLSFTDLFGRTHIEPSVTGLVRVQTRERPKPVVFNDIYLLGPTRSGAPGVLRRFSSLAALEDAHDPDGTGDELVALARTMAAPFADRDMHGAADIVTLRVDPATPATTRLAAGSTDLVEITGDYGIHANRARRRLTAGTQAGKKLVLADDVRTFTGDNLGPALTVQYTGNASAATLTILQETARIALSGQPTDGDKVTVATGAGESKTFEFESAGGVTSGNVAVTIGADVDATLTNLATAIAANLSAVTAQADTSNDWVTVNGPDVGVQATEVTDTGAVITITHLGAAARLQTSLTNPTDGSANLDVPLTFPSYSTLQKLAAYIGNQNGYTAAVSPYANKFLASTGLDAVSGADISSQVTLTGYVAAIVDWVNGQTRGLYSATELARGEPDEDAADVFFTGGSSPAATINDWSNALDTISAEVEKGGGILLLDTDDPAVLALVTAWIETERAAGKWWRAYFGLQPALTTDEYKQIVGAVDNSRVRLVVQRPGVFAPGGGVVYLDPVFLAAMLAGGAAGNRPYERPLTNKRLRLAGVHPDDQFDVVTREDLIGSGITVVKKEGDLWKVALGVTASLDPTKRMPRIASEIDTVDEIDAAVREAFLPFRGRWSNSNVAARVRGVMGQVLDRYVSNGALSAGFDDQGQEVPPWQLLSFSIDQGVLTINYQVHIAGELNHVSILGRSDYVRLVGDGSGGTVALSASVQT